MQKAKFSSRKEEARSKSGGKVRKSEFKRGFTLLEMVLAIGLFSVLVISAVGITLQIYNAELKTSSIQLIQDNSRFSLELITKELRTGSNYALTSICAPLGSEISFDSTSGRRIYFLKHDLKKIFRATQDITSAQCQDQTKALPFTADEVWVEKLTFRMLGANPGPQDGQPAVTLSMRVRAAEPRYGAETFMNLQTTVVRRLRDL